MLDKMPKPHFQIPTSIFTEMMEQESGSGDGVACNNCSVYCRADGAYLCPGCDSRIHAANQEPTGHERVLVCEACEQAPAVFLCKADAALLCTSCDTNIHSANLLSRRHHRVSISGSLYTPPGTLGTEFLSQEAEEGEAASWLLLNPVKTTTNNNNDNQINNVNNGVLLGDEYLDLFGYNSIGHNQFNEQYNQDDQEEHKSCGIVLQKSSYGGDSVVPVQCGEAKDGLQQHQLNFQLGLEYEPSKPKVYSFNGSISPSVPISSLEVGVVPESTISGNSLSLSHTRTPTGAIGLLSATPVQIPQQLTPMDREARVLRYREKKKTRKFDKTIRYASRKAYAETRARIKGRFAKRTDVESEVDQMFSTTLMTETGYGTDSSF